MCCLFLCVDQVSCLFILIIKSLERCLQGDLNHWFDIQHTLPKSVKLFFGIKYCVKIMLSFTRLNESPPSRTEPQPFNTFTFTRLEGT